MFGWEFPPHIAGGLGTACYGMTRGLARNDVEVIFVMPKASGDEDERFVKVVNASDVEARYCYYPCRTPAYCFQESCLESPLESDFVHL